MDHVPVLAGPAVEYLRIREDGVYVDCTAGAGGHSALIAERLSERGTLVALDRDPAAVKLTRERLKPYAQVQGGRGGYRARAARVSEGGLAGGGGCVASAG